MILIGMIGLTLLLPIFIWLENAVIATLLLIPTGLVLYSAYSPAVVLGQQYLPNHVGLSSGVTLAVAVAIGGAAAPFR